MKLKPFIALSLLSLLTVPTAAAAVTYRVFATREGLVGGRTSNGHIITSHDHFCALPSSTALNANGGYTYTVTISNPANGRVASNVPQWDVGPWNTTDNYWHVPRAAWADLVRGLPEAQAAYQNGYNGGKDGFGRTVANPAGIDLADGTFWDDLGMVDNGWVDVTYNWEVNTSNFTQQTYNQPVGNHSGGAMEIFTTASAAGGAIYSSVESGVNAPFQAWNNGVCENWGSPKPIALGTQPDGRMQIFIVGQDLRIYTKWQNTPGGPWSGWAGLGGNILRIAVGRNADGRLQLFMLGTDRQIWQTSQTGPNSNGSFGGWSTFGENAMDLPIAVGNNADGRLEFFFIGTDSHVYTWWQTAPNSGSWGRAGLDGLVSSVDVGNNKDGRLQLYSIGRDDKRVYCLVQLAPNGGWNSWSSFGENAQPGICYAPRADGAQQFFFVGTDSQVYTWWQSGPNSSTWYRAGLGAQVKPGLAAGLNTDGRISLFGLDLNGGAWTTWQTSPNGPWSSWSYFGSGGGGFSTLR